MTSEPSIDNSNFAHVAIPPYRPSWVDRLDDWLGGLPGPRWLAYALPAAVLVIINTLIKWWDGAYPVGTFFLFHVVVITGAVWYFALISYLDWTAGRAMEQFRPVFNGDEQTLAQVTGRLITLPARPTLVVSLAGALFGCFVVYGAQKGMFLSPAIPAFTSPLSLWFDGAIVVAGNVGLFVFVYHTVHQLRVVNLLYTAYAHVDLYRTGPLHSFSILTATTAGLGILTGYIWLVAEPDLEGDVVSLTILAVLALLAVLTFVTPLLGIHRLLVATKNAVLDEAAQRVKVIVAELHRGVDNHQYADLDALSKALAGLKDELAILEKVPTWPWQPDTLRLLSTAILLPAMLWLVTRLLERLLTL